MEKGRRGPPPLKVRYKRRLASFKDVAKSVGCSVSLVRKYWRSHGRTLKGFVYKRRKWDGSGNGTNIDTLFLTGRIPVDVYYSYLKRYAVMSRSGKGKIAVGEVVDGKTYYRMTRFDDYFFGTSYADAALGFLDYSFEDVAAFANEHLPPPPDFTCAVIREVEDYGTSPQECDSWPIAEHWRVAGYGDERRTWNGGEAFLDRLLAILEGGDETG